MRLLPLLLLAACATAEPRPASTLIPIALQGPDDQPAELGRVAAGRPLVVDFFASWCEACRAGLPALNELARTHAAGDLVVVGVDVGEPAPIARRFAERAGISYPVYLDPELRLQDSLGVSALPLILVVDGAGRIVHRSAGLDAETLAVIQALPGLTAANR
jgi:thiol-disulfide isomerase/thioredoxin